MMKSRRFLACLILTLLCAISVYAAIVIDKHNFQDNSATGSTTIALTLTSTTAGSLVTCQWTWSTSSGNTFTKVSDNVNGPGTSYSIAIASHTNGTIGQLQGQVYFANNAGGTLTITALATQSVGFGAMACQTWTGAATVSPLDVAATVKDSSGTNPTCNAMTTTVNGDVVISSIIVDTSVPTAGATYTVADTMPFTFSVAEYLIQATAGSTTVPWVSASSQNYGCMASAYKAAGGGGPTVVPRHRSTEYGSNFRKESEGYAQISPAISYSHPALWSSNSRSIRAVAD